MRVAVLVKATEQSERGVKPNIECLTKMGKFNEELVKAGIMLAGDGLHPSSKGTRVQFTANGPSAIDGPFAETKELVAGFWVWKVKSLEEAVAWLKRAPFENGDTVEIRPIFELEDFGASYTPELRQRQQRLEEQMAAYK